MTVTFALPISSYVAEIEQFLGRYQVFIISGETGSGKSTQLPKICLAAGRGASGRIGITQPRRLAARSLADRVAEELSVPLGGLVGYQVRFQDKCSEHTRIKFMTDGILLTEIHDDPLLKRYDTIIIDEAHERSLNIDFLLGYLSRLLPRRPDLKLIITSATIDTELFSAHFKDAPVIEVSGRSYPIEVLYRPIGQGDSDKDLYQGIHLAVMDLSRLDAKKDILVFLSGEREISETASFLKAGGLSHTEVLPLFARLSNQEQQRIFHPGPFRRIILATNIAETSLTVPGIRFVIDSGRARISRYSHQAKVLRLPVEPVSQASANQRSGRCGRLGPGVCIRLYSEEEFLQRPEYTEPEIQRTSLASVILKMAALDLGQIEDFPFVEPPPKQLINDAFQVLLELGAMTSDRIITRLGQKLARWPVDVRLGRIILEAQRRQALNEILILVAVMSIRDPLERPLEAQQEADEAHEKFADPSSDFMSLLKLWDYLAEQKKALSGSQFRKMCRRDFLSWLRIREWTDLHRQLRQLAKQQKLTVNNRPASFAAIHKSLLSGMLSHAGLKLDKGEYLGARNKKFYIFPGSGLFAKPPKWIMAAELVETTRVYARLNAAIEPEWLEECAGKLLRRAYSEPFWSKKSGQAQAWEKLSLFGLVVVERRRSNYSTIDPEQSRRLFIRHALVRGELRKLPQFILENQRRVERVEDLEHKRRSRDVLVEERVLEEFFAARIPADVLSTKQLIRWLDPEIEQQLLYPEHLLVRQDAGQAGQNQYPDWLEMSGHRLPLSYKFEPGHPDDGVTLRVPLHLLNQIDPRQLDWLVPGLLEERVMAMIKALPKPIRRALTPAPQYAAEFLARQGGEPDGDLMSALARQFKAIAGIEVAAAEWRKTDIPDHLKFRLQVLDKQDQVLASSRQVRELQQQFGSRARRLFMDRQGLELHRDGETSWQFEDIPEQTNPQPGLTAYPALVDQDQAVGLRLFDTLDEARQQHQAGIIRLVTLQIGDKIRYLKKNHGIKPEALLQWRAIGSAAGLIDDLIHSGTADLCGNTAAVRDVTSFDQLLAGVRAGLVESVSGRARLLNEIMDLYQQLWRQLQAVPDSLPPAVEDIQSQLDDLLYEGFMQDVSGQQLEHYPRYLSAILLRLTGLRQNPGRDQQRLQQVLPYWHRYLDYLDDPGVYSVALDDYRWLLEEFRVSLFAQQLGTVQKVSPQRLDQAWERVQKEAVQD